MAAADLMPYCFEPEAGDFSEFCSREFDADVYQQLVAAGICRDCRVGSNDGGAAREVEEGSRREVCKRHPTVAQQRASDARAAKSAESTRRSRSLTPAQQSNVCMCTSNQCWLLACVASSQCKTRERQGLHVRGGQFEACPFPREPGSKVCMHCRCAAPGCERRTRNRSRFCENPKCAGKRWSDKQGPLDYVNQHGFQKADPTWPSGLQVAAKWSWVLCDIPPLDYVEFRRLVQLVGAPDARISPRGFVAITLGQFLKWPAAVAHFRE